MGKWLATGAGVLAAASSPFLSISFFHLLHSYLVDSRRKYVLFGGDGNPHTRTQQKQTDGQTDRHTYMHTDLDWTNSRSSTHKTPQAAAGHKR